MLGLRILIKQYLLAFLIFCFNAHQSKEIACDKKLRKQEQHLVDSSISLLTIALILN